MNTWEAAILGFLQGATEFLPVSSSGHLVIGQELLGVNIEGVGFEVAVHLATLISVMVVYRERIQTLLTGAFQRDADAWRYMGLIVVATIPAAVIGIGLGDLLERLFEIPQVTGGALLFTAALLWSSKGPLGKELEGRPDLRAAILIGFAQAMATIPGISRSGSTVVLALWLGIEAREAAAFSFLMAIPAIAGAAVLQLPDLMGGEAVGPGMTPLLVGGVVAAITGILAIKSFVALLARKGFHAFGAYCALAGGGFLVYLAMAGG